MSSPHEHLVVSDTLAEEQQKEPKLSEMILYLEKKIIPAVVVAENVH